VDPGGAQANLVSPACGDRARQSPPSPKSWLLASPPPRPPAMQSGLRTVLGLAVPGETTSEPPAILGPQGAATPFGYAR